MWMSKAELEREFTGPLTGDDVERLNVLLAKARLDEAEWWKPLVTNQHLRSCSFNQTDGPEGDYCTCKLSTIKKAITEHIAVLEQQANGKKVGAKCPDCGHRLHAGVSCLESDACGCGQ